MLTDYYFSSSFSYSQKTKCNNARNIFFHFKTLCCQSKFFELIWQSTDRWRALWKNETGLINGFRTTNIFRSVLDFLFCPRHDQNDTSPRYFMERHYHTKFHNFALNHVLSVLSILKHFRFVVRRFRSTNPGSAQFIKGSGHSPGIFQMTSQKEIHWSQIWPARSPEEY